MSEDRYSGQCKEICSNYQQYKCFDLVTQTRINKYHKYVLEMVNKSITIRTHHLKWEQFVQR